MTTETLTETPTPDPSTPAAPIFGPHRALRIALNAAPHLSRPAAYRLAAQLGVPGAQMARALAVDAKAEETAERELAAAARLGATVLLREDPGYPAALRQLDLPPPVLYVLGAFGAFGALESTRPAVAVVGSRRADSYGQEVAELFARDLAAAGITIISGFAHGIDAAAHHGALASSAGTTVAVLGCGLGVDYPRGHSRLAEDIAARGALLSEFPCGLSPRSWHFPVRNRVIAALAAGTLVVQAAPRSGSLITARHALDLGREVWAVPGRIFDERSLGPNALIRDGATLVQHPQDILDILLPALHSQPGLFPAAAPKFNPPAPAPLPNLPNLPPPPAGLPADILASLTPGTLRLPEEIANGLAVPVDGVLGALLELELGGWVRRHPGSAYGRL